MIAKRLFDLIFCVPGIIILSPLLVMVAVWVKLDSHGPAFFRQTRVGRNGQLFRIFKFRTMCCEAESRGRLITVGDDPCITRSGRFLRRYKLDELPQLFNVLKGEMSLVGPRPEVPRYVALYPDEVRERVLSVPPGITDYASTEYRDESALLATAKDPENLYINEIMPAKLKCYERYVAERSIWLDFRLILTTLKTLYIR